MPQALGLKPAILAARQRLADGRAKVRARHDRGSPGVQVCGATSDLLDAVVLDLFHAALEDLNETGEGGLASDVTLVAHGGYGRRDVAPFSDVDLMILHAPTAAARVARLAERLMRDVFDCGLVLGHSVRTPEQACDLALGDATICTSLMESRYLAGSEPLYQRFAQRFQQRVQRRAQALIASIDAARGEERNQYGETVYLLEPNLKRSRGGLRDMQLLRWVGFARYGRASTDDLQLAGALSKPDQQAVRLAWEFLLRVRNEMHFFAGKSNDVLDRTEQVRLAERFGHPGDAGMLPVEQFMREYFLHTDGVSHIVTRFVANARRDSLAKELVGWLFSHQVEGDFRVGPLGITATQQGLEKLRGDLGQVLRLADLASLYDKPIAHATCEAIRASAAEMSDDVSPEVGERFLSLLGQRARLGWLLRFLHEMGVLEKIVPAFVHARCLLQFNEYHKYTVDEHCLRAVERAAEFARDDGPLGRVYQRIRDKRLLHLALLIHDLGKGYVEDHSDVGLRIATETARRLRLSEREREVLEFLVHKHLVMSHLAFRRDTGDEQLVLRFAIDVGSPELMRMLFLLTCADLAAVGPGVLNDWKVEVLSSLYARAMVHLAGEAPALASHERLAQRREEVRAALAADAEDRWYERQIAAMPAAYLEASETPQTAAELRELRRLREGEVAARGRYLPESRTVEYTIGTYESIVPGVFHRLCGALSGSGLQILSAEINTLADGLVLDRFFVRDPDYADEPPGSRLDGVCEALRASLLQPDAAPRFRRLWRGAQQDRAALPTLPTQVKVDNSTSDRYTIVDVFAADRLGLLFAITRTLFELGLNVSVAKIGTYLDQVVDVFYVADEAGRKIEAEDRIEAIRRRLFEEIETQERRDAEQLAAR